MDISESTPPSTRILPWIYSPNSSVYTAAVIGYLDPSWLTERNLNYVNTLVRDYANPIRGEQFPFSRAFDWFK